MLFFTFFVTLGNPFFRSMRATNQLLLADWSVAWTNLVDGLICSTHFNFLYSSSHRPYRSQRTDDGTRLSLCCIHCIERFRLV